MAAAAWSWVEKMLQTPSGPGHRESTRVSISTAVCTVSRRARHPGPRPAAGPQRGIRERSATRPGISCSARVISLRPKSAQRQRATFEVDARSRGPRRTDGRWSPRVSGRAERFFRDVDRRDGRRVDSLREREVDAGVVDRARRRDASRSTAECTLCAQSGDRARRAPARASSEISARLRSSRYSSSSRTSRSRSGESSSIGSAKMSSGGRPPENGPSKAPRAGCARPRVARPSTAGCFAVLVELAGEPVRGHPTPVRAELPQTTGSDPCSPTARGSSTG